MIYADTSFIVSAYTDDAGTKTAVAYLEKNEPLLPFVFLHWPEVAGSLYKNQPEAGKIWDIVRQDMADATKLNAVPVDAERVGRRAAGIMSNYCRRWPRLRAVDTMHVAAAVELGAKKFLSFDTNSFQRVLAASQKMEVWPPLDDVEKARLK